MAEETVMAVIEAAVVVGAVEVVVAMIGTETARELMSRKNQRGQDRRGKLVLGWLITRRTSQRSCDAIYITFNNLLIHSVSGVLGFWGDRKSVV